LSSSAASIPISILFCAATRVSLRQILMHLGNNAIKFTAHGEIAVEVTRIVQTHQQLKARFEVRDTGIGIAKDKINFLFRAFQQMDASTTRQFGGMGLGLTISKRLAEKMGGEIGVNQRCRSRFDVLVHRCLQSAIFTGSP
jgi:signal transduction histidine kinase